MKKGRRPRRRPTLNIVDKSRPDHETVPLENARFPAEMAGFLAASRAVPPYPVFLKYVVSLQLSVFVEHERREAAYTRKMYRYKAQYSLDVDNGTEKSIQFVSLSPDEIYERKLTVQQLHAAIAALPDRQAKRIYAHYILGMSKTAIAKAEGVDEKAVRGSIERGLKNMEKILKNLF